MNLCTICYHPMIDSIDGDNRAGNVVAAAYGVSAQALRRHRRGGHVVPHAGGMSPPPGVPPAGAHNSSTTPLEALLRQRDQLDSTDITSLSPAMRIATWAERRRTEESIAKLQPPEVTVTASMRELQAMSDMATVIDEVLERHHEVRAEVAVALAAWKKETR